MEILLSLQDVPLVSRKVNNNYLLHLTIINRVVTSNKVTAIDRSIETIIGESFAVSSSRQQCDIKHRCNYVYSLITMALCRVRSKYLIGKQSTHMNFCIIKIKRLQSNTPTKHMLDIVPIQPWW